MTKRSDATLRSVLISERIRLRTDLHIRHLVDDFQCDLEFFPLADLMISKQAWEYIANSDVEPRRVFAHPTMLRANPVVSQYYRGIALLPQKRVTDIAGSIANWENGSRKHPIKCQQAKDVARLYNAVISSIIEGSSNWTIQNGYRNIIATMGIGLDGTFRNIIGQDAENLIKTRIVNWLKASQLIVRGNDEGTEFELNQGYTMRYGSEPDILFQHEQSGITQIVATIEIKGGKDQAGALERLGAMQKSFNATPPNCENMLVAGVITDEMRNRLSQIGVTKVFLLDDLAHDGEKWMSFLDEVFHYTVRIIGKTIV